MDGVFFDGWDVLLRTCVIGVLAYAGLIVLLRLSGKRTLSKMNAFDFVVTVALGSTLATILLNRNVPLSQGLIAFAVLIGLQFLITWSSVRAPWVRRLVTGEPTLMFYRGEFVREALRRARVSEDEIRAAVRGAGRPALEENEAVVLETDGSFSIIAGGGGTGASSLTGVRRPGHADGGDT